MKWTEVVLFYTLCYKMLIMRLVEILIKRLNEMNINTTLHEMYGVYIIELDKTGYKKQELENIINIMSDSMSLVYYSQLSNCLCLNTNISNKLR